MNRIDRILLAAIAAGLWASVALKVIGPVESNAGSTQQVDIVAVGGRTVYDGMIPVKTK